MSDKKEIKEFVFVVRSEPLAAFLTFTLLTLIIGLFSAVGWLVIESVIGIFNWL